LLTLIIVSYNSANTLVECMDELLQSAQFRTIIVDNNSTDGSAETLQSRYPKAEVIPLDTNIGYGRAANMGLKKVDTPYAFLLNPDLCARPSDITKLLEWICQNKHGAALYAPAVKKSDFLHGGPIEREWVIGAAMLFEMERMKHIGFFDENIFLFYEEKDLCLRIQQGNEKIILCSDFYIHHIKGQCCPPDEHIRFIKNWHVGWSSMYYFTKHGIATGNHKPKRLLRKYLSKRCTSLDPAKREKFRVRSCGIRAFLRNEKAFNQDGTPKTDFIDLK